ncbi:MAG: N-6 DNA methylase, partial [Gemmatimonas sp.]|uniref:N-6 DNA methylase n=1 Tax=Gemmatimonas sp. TaxID=1962908 RepID=UPI00391F157D
NRARIIATYQHRTEAPRYSRRVEMAEIEKNDFNLNISRYISTAVGDEEIDLAATNAVLSEIENEIRAARDTHNEFLRELGLKLLPIGTAGSRGAPPS